jgi:LuxR family transcriptional regulator, maltose regulon positive regulatory protein
MRETDSHQMSGTWEGWRAVEQALLASMRFASAKFRPMALPPTLVARPVLHDRLTAGAGKRLTVVVGSAGAGKSVLLSSWAAARPAGATSWLSCDRADQDPVRFWSGFVEAVQSVAPEFGADAPDLLAMDHAVTPDVTASIANDAAKLPAGSAIVVDDFHHVSATAAKDMADLVASWPSQTAQLVLSSRVDPPLRLHKLRMSGELCELRQRDLCFSLPESRDLLAKFGVRVADDELALLHQRSEGWAAALQMAALSLRGTKDPARMARALDIRSHAIAEYFISEVLEQQPPEVVQFMLDTSILGPLTAEACAAVTERQDAAVLLRDIDAANLFLVALDEERITFRYHHLVRQVLRAELRARDRARERMLRRRAAQWYEVTGEKRRAARYYLTAGQIDRALDLLQEQVVADFLRDPVLPAPLDMSAVNPALLVETPDRLLGLAADLLIAGDMARGGEYLRLLDGLQPPIPTDSGMAAHLMALQSFHHSLLGQLDEAVRAGLAARASHGWPQVSSEWDAAASLVLLRIYPYLENYDAVEREAATALELPGSTEPARLVLVPGTRAVAMFEAGRLHEAADAARAAEVDSRRLGFDQHLFAVDYLRVLAGLALERRDLDTAEQLTERVVSIAERRRPLFEFLALLDRAAIWSARGHVHEALATVKAARLVLPEACPALLARADELEALLRLSLGDVRSPTELASGLDAARQRLLLARIALTVGDHHTAEQHLQALSKEDLTPRRELMRQVLLAAAAMERDDPTVVGILGSALQMARRGGFLNTVVTTAPQVSRYLVEDFAQAPTDPFIEQLTAAALEACAAQPTTSRPGRALAEPLTAAELRILKLLPTSTYLQIAAILYISRNTVKTHLRSIYQKLGVTSRSAAIERAVDLRLL